ncbi:hypothetical protein TrCOL_g1001 [Triparma columacea]|uniref:Tyrosyl-DNA phosphodiesterase n=1 Tax=Triparma columacea TaxID=722753 RepID=A0A9W7L1C7_9STRA|nr:hypothetical protein TrCOL_g1001 [Triparma columacea]
MTNGIYVQDFPLKSSAEDGGGCVGGGEAHPFEKTLVDYLEVACKDVSGCDVVRRVKMFDFRRANATLVGSVPGKFKLGAEDGETKWGQEKMKRELREKVDWDENSRVVLQFSSLGSTTEKIITNLVETFNTTRPPPASTSPSSPSIFENFSVNQLQQEQPAIIWPTVNDVASSLDGYSSGNSIPAPPKSLFDFDKSSTSVPRTLKIKSHLAPMLHKWGDPSLPRTSAAPHIKTFLRYKASTSGEPSGELCWVMMSSHNFSQASWGAVQLKGVQLSIEHYELGVLFVERDFWGGEEGEGNKVWNEPFSNTPEHAKLGMGGIVNLTALRRGGENVRIRVPDCCLGSGGGGGGRGKDEVVDLTGESDDEEGGGGEKREDKVGVLIAPVPYSIPPKKYGEGDVPWCSEFKRGVPKGVKVVNNFYEGGGAGGGG